VARLGKSRDSFDDFSREELEEFVREKERIRQIVGQVGGRPTIVGKVMNIMMIVFILATLAAAPFLPEHLELPAVEIGLVLLSIKIFYFLHNEAKVIHFQFWMLSSLEWRLNDMAKRIINIDKAIQQSAEKKENKK